MFDLKTRRIPNWWTLCGAAGWAWWTAVNQAGAASVGFILRILAVAVILFPLFLFRMIGAGDIKLMCLSCGCLGLSDGFVMIWYGFVIGAVLSLLKMLLNGSFLCRISYFIAYFRQTFQTRKICPYLVPSKDGYQATIHLAVCLWLGFVVFMAVQGGEGGRL